MSTPAALAYPTYLQVPGTDGVAWQTVATLLELPPGALRRVSFGDLDVLLAHTPDGLVATDDRCPHMAAPLSIGSLEGCVVACPLHKGRFDLATGEVVVFPTTGGLDADGGSHPTWSAPGSEPKPEPSDAKALARALTRVRRMRYYPLRVVGETIELKIPSVNAAPGRTARGLAWRWGPAIAWMLLIFILSAQPGLKISADASVDGPVRHLAHIAVYAVLAVLFTHAVAGLGRPVTARTALVVAALTIGYGVTDELHQAFVPDRTANPVDVGYDAIGAAIGIGTAWAWGRSRVRGIRSSAEG